MNEQLTVLQVKDKRIALDRLILKAIRDFENETGCNVQSVSLQNERDFGERLPKTIFTTTNVII